MGGNDADRMVFLHVPKPCAYVLTEAVGSLPVSKSLDEIEHEALETTGVPPWLIYLYVPTTYKSRKI